jgi:hypothetical protein
VFVVDICSDYPKPPPYTHGKGLTENFSFRSLLDLHLRFIVFILSKEVNDEKDLMTTSLVQQSNPIVVESLGQWCSNAAMQAILEDIFSVRKDS